MKKVLILLLILIPFIAMAQGNLQFNQVLDLTNSANYTVPVGKVFKVESVNAPNAVVTGSYIGYGSSFGFDGTYYYVACSYNVSNIICIGSICLGGAQWSDGSVKVVNDPPHDTIGHCPSISTIGGYLYPSSSSGYPIFNLPIWLKEGQQINIMGGSGILVSGIEFNVVP